MQEGDVVVVISKITGRNYYCVIEEKKYLSFVPLIGSVYRLDNSVFIRVCNLTEFFYVDYSVAAITQEEYKEYCKLKTT